MYRNSDWPEGKDIFDSQSKTVNLLQLSVPHVPLFLHPFGELLDLELQVLQDID